MIERFVHRWNRYWFAEASLLRLAAFRIVVLVIAAWEVWRCGPTFLLEGNGRGDAPLLYRQYQPLYLLELLGIDPPGALVANTVMIVLLVSIVLGLIGLFTRTALFVTTMVSLYVYAVVYSFGQGHHDKVALAVALMALPFSPASYRLSIDRWLRPTDDVTAKRQFAGWTILFVQVSVALGYSAAGFSKLLKGGLEWMNGYSLQAVFLAGDMPLSEPAASSLAFAVVMSVATVLLQATFPICLFVRPLRWVYVPGIVAFHFGNWLIVNTGHQIGMWGIVLAAFVPLHSVCVRAFGLADD